MRRDATAAWGRYHKWPDSYSRYIQYIWSRYQANVCVYSPIHYDWVGMAMTERELNTAANQVIEQYGPPPFGTLATCNSSLSSQVNFGQFEDNRWLTLQQIGNWREHVHYWYLTEIYHTRPSRPAINGESYYSGYQDRRDYTYAYRRPGRHTLGRPVHPFHPVRQPPLRRPGRVRVRCRGNLGCRCREGL